MFKQQPDFVQIFELAFFSATAAKIFDANSWFFG